MMKKFISLLGISLISTLAVKADTFKELNIHNMTDHPLFVQVNNFFNVEVFGAEDGKLGTTIAPHERIYFPIKIKKDESVVEVLLFEIQKDGYLTHPICEATAAQNTDGRTPFYNADVFQNDSKPLQCVLTDGFTALTVQEIY